MELKICSLIIIKMMLYPVTMLEKFRDSPSGDIDNNKEVDVQEGDAEHITDDSSRTVRMDMVRRPVRQVTLTVKKMKNG